MIYLIIVSLIWALSFGLIGNYLTSLPSDFVALLRLLLSLLIFLPFVRKIPLLSAIKLMFLGAIQFGIMYLTYIKAFSYLPSYQVALFTMTTPLYVVLINDLHTLHPRLKHFLAALLVIIGCAIIQWKGGNFRDIHWHGFLILQISNFCFALGQWLYSRLSLPADGGNPDAGKSFFAYLYLGACLVLIPFAYKGFLTNFSAVTQKQWGILLYLGIVASGVCFFLWNVGARRVTSTQLAVMNNLKIPLAALCSLTLFGESANWLTLIPGLVLVCIALILARES